MCNIVCFVVKLTKTISNSLVLCLPTKMRTKKTLDRQVSLKQPEDSSLPDDMCAKLQSKPFMFEVCPKQFAHALCLRPCF